MQCVRCDCAAMLRGLSKKVHTNFTPLGNLFSTALMGKLILMFMLGRCARSAIYNSIRKIRKSRKFEKFVISNF